jgi:hypothetical protein
MNTKTLKLGKSTLAVCLLSAQLLIFSSNALAEAKGNGGVIGGGGGDQVTLQNTTVLADRYSNNVDPNEALDSNQLSIKDVTEELNMILSVYSKYFGSTLLSRNVLSKEIMYLNVKTIPEREICKKHLTYSGIPDDSQVDQFACTEGLRTFIINERFIKLSKRDRALGLIHEGLRRLKASDYILTSITNGLRVAMENYDLQTKGDFSHELNESELNSLYQLSRAALMLSHGYQGTEYEFRTIKDQIKFSEFGGILNKSKAKFTKAKLGVGANFFILDSTETSIDDSAVILNSVVCQHVKKCIVGKEVVLDNVVLFPKNMYLGAEILTSIHDNVKLKDVKISEFYKLDIGEDANISNIILFGSSENSTDIKIENKTVLKDFTVGGCFNTTTLKIRGEIDGKGVSGAIYPPYPLTFTNISSVAELRKRMYLK